MATIIIVVICVFARVHHINVPGESTLVTNVISIAKYAKCTLILDIYTQYTYTLARPYEEKAS